MKYDPAVWAQMAATLVAADVSSKAGKETRYFKRGILDSTVVMDDVADLYEASVRRCNEAENEIVT